MKILPFATKYVVFKFLNISFMHVDNVHRLRTTFRNKTLI
jgi:hypothetical protein